MTDSTSAQTRSTVSDMAAAALLWWRGTGLQKREGERRAGVSRSAHSRAGDMGASPAAGSASQIVSHMLRMCAFLGRT
jgi:hypothetical protein